MAKDWWKSFFTDSIGEILFEDRANLAVTEVNEILRRTKLRKSATILDVACGVGRHSFEFAKHGHNVVGLDYSQSYINTAARRSSRTPINKRPQFVRGDMRQLEKAIPAKKFDLAVSLFNSFGYFDKRSDDLKMLKSMARVLQPGGMLIINTLNLNGVIHRLIKVPALMDGHGHHTGCELKKNLFFISNATFDCKKRKTDCCWTVIDGRKGRSVITKLPFTQNVYSHRELTQMLGKCGFKIKAIWGKLHGTKFNESTSWHQTILAQLENS